jgi:hypothetical protein
MNRCSIILDIPSPPSAGLRGADVPMQTVRVEFSVLPPDPSAGIIGYGSEDHTLHDIKSGERLTDFEDDAPDEFWDWLADRVNEKFDFYAAEGGLHA